MRKAILALDGGGTKTVAMLTDLRGHRLSRAVGGPMNVQRMMDDELRAVLMPMLARLFAEYTGMPIELVAVGAGFAGAGTIPSHEPLRDLLRNALAVAAADYPMHIVTSPVVEIQLDMAIALLAGAGAHRGIVLISGTGSSVYGEHAGGTARVGGWGPAFGDEGSGYAIGLQALRRVMHVHDGRLPASSLASAVCAAWKCDAPPELLEAWRTQQPSVADIAQLTAVVAAEAEQGDALARSILLEAATELACCVVTAAEQLGLTDVVFPLIMSGGVLQHVPLVAAEVCARVADRAPQARPQMLAVEPVWGAVQLALQSVSPAAEI